jgi:hypothetical protein
MNDASQTHKNMITGRLRNGIGAQCSVLKRFLHPRTIVDAKYPNTTQSERLESLLVTRREVKRVNNKDQWCIIFRHDDFDNIEVYATERYCKVTHEGPAESYFEVLVPGGETAVEESHVPIPVLTNNRSEDIAAMHAQNFDIDDDNEPAPENIPSPADEPEQPTSIYKEWGSTGVDHRRAAGHDRFERATLISAINGNDSRISIFLLFLPRLYITTVLIPATNLHLPGVPITLGELLVFLGLWLLMATTLGASRNDFWDATPPSAWTKAPFRLHDYMSQNRFEQILEALTYTDKAPPTYRDKFHQVRQLLAAFSANMNEVFMASWVSSVDQSISIWTSQWTCPGFMFVPRKPHPMGNEYHSICCGESGIMYDIELVEGKDAPREQPVPEHNEKGKTVGLLLRLCKHIYGTGKVVILDSSFCVLQGIVELKKVGIYASALIKKKQGFWPKHIKGEEIKGHFNGRAVGDTDRLPGVHDGVDFDIFAMKEPDYTMMLVSTYGSLVVKDGQKQSHRKWQSNSASYTATFKYTETFGNHFNYRGAVDDHNNRRHNDGGTHQGVSLERAWQTSRWENRVFSFIVAVVEVNVYLARRYFFGKDEVFMEFRKKLAYELLHNTLDGGSPPTGSPGPLRSRPSASPATHKLVKAPQNKRFEDGEWRISYKRKYQQHLCSTNGCKKRMRTVCICNMAKWLCSDCFANHVLTSINTTPE